ncbi:MAG: response regulator [Verrucomicrobiota bacterium]
MIYKSGFSNNSDQNGSTEIRCHKIVVAAWDREVREGLSAMLAKRGHEVLACSTASEAMSICELQDPSAVVFEADGYGMDAVQFVRWICARRLGSEGRLYSLALGDCADEAWLSMMLKAGTSDCSSVSDPGDWSRAALVMEQKIDTSRQEATELAAVKRLRQRYENLFLEAPDAMLVLKPKDGRIIGVNRAVFAVLGYEGRELLGKYLSLVFPEFFAGEGREAFENFLRQIAKTRGVQYRTPEGSKKLLDLSVATVTWEESSAFMLSCRDVTQSLSTEKLSGSASKSEALSSFARGVGADLNDALTAIGGNLELLGMRPDLGTEARALSKSASDAVSQARTLAATLRSVGKTNPETTQQGAPFLLRDIVESEVLAQGLLGDTVEPDFKFSEMPLWIRGDANAIRGLVRELTNNATEAMSERRGSKFFVQFWECQLPPVNPLNLPGGNYARVVFEDEGCGINGDDVEKVFDPYYSTWKGRRGLGLTRANSIAVRHGGRLVASRREEGGAKFELYLPLHEIATVTTEPVEKSPSRSSDQNHSSEGKRVLVLEDEAEIRLLIERALGMHGYEVFSVASGEDAITAFRRSQEYDRPFDLLIFDLEIRGGLGGRETLNFLRRQGVRTKAVVTTGIADEEMLSNLSDYGFCGVIRKPFRLEQLIETVGTLTGSVPARRVED